MYATKPTTAAPARPDAAAGLTDQRAAAVTQRRLQAMADQSPRAVQLAAIDTMLRAGVAQLERKAGPDGNEIEVTPIADYMPVCLDETASARAVFYYRGSEEPAEWNNTDYFYAEPDGQLVQVTVDQVNQFWDARYQGFEKLAPPSRQMNCEDYAKDERSDGASVGTFDRENSARLAELLTEDRKYVVQLSFHWMRVEKTSDAAVTIRQKDAESAVYTKTYAKADAVAYICSKLPNQGTVYQG